MAAKATFFKVTATSNAYAVPKLEIHAVIVLDTHGEITDVDTASIRGEVENACDVFTHVRSGAKK